MSAKNAAENEPRKRIDTLRELLSLVVENTKRTNANRPLKKGEDTKRKSILAALLGRRPTEDELALAGRY